MAEGFMGCRVVRQIASCPNRTRQRSTTTWASTTSKASWPLVAEASGAKVTVVGVSENRIVP